MGKIYLVGFNMDGYEIRTEIVLDDNFYDENIMRVMAKEKLDKIGVTTDGGFFEVYDEN